METEMEQEEVVTMTEDMSDISQLCRVCANPNEYLIPIFHGEGLEHDLKSKVSRHLPIQIRESDSLPVQLCYQCASTLIAWSDLVEGCAEADEKLREMLPEGAQTDVTLDEETGLQSDPKFSTFSSKVVTMTSLEEIPAAKAEVLEDMSSMDQDAADIEPAQQRSLTFRSYQLAIDTQKQKLLGLEEKRELIEPEFRFSYVATDAETSEDVLEISLPLDDHNNDPDLPIDEYEYDGSQFKSKLKPACDICKKTFTRGNDLKRHMVTLHNMEALEKEIEEKGEHFVDNFPTIPLFTCEVCHRIFKKRDNFDRHRMTHTGEKPFECDVCLKLFRVAGERNRHKRNVHVREPKYKCLQCTRWFNSSCLLNDHVLIHQEKRTKQCPECGDMFKTNACLHQHKRGVHSSVLLVCKCCNKVFRRKVDLNNHLATHANEKNHRCDECGKRFNTKTDLRRHAVIHRNESHECSMCPAKFAHRRYLTAHLRTVHKVVSARSALRAAAITTVETDPLS